jgi:K+-transporting ATPase KdpF subunit
MAYIYAFAGLIALGLMVYLVIALLKPEVFE